MQFTPLSAALLALASLASATTTLSLTTRPASTLRPSTSLAIASDSNRPAGAAGAGTVSSIARTTLATIASANRPSVTASKASSAATKPSPTPIGNIPAPPITDSGDPDRPFEVNSDTFVDVTEATMRACSIQNNQCADAVNDGSVTDADVSDCSDQETVCNNAA